MAKPIKAVIKLQCSAGKANPAPPVGPALGQHGVNIMELKMKNNIIVNYFTSSWHELKKVSWPTRKEVLNHTVIVVISASIAIAVTGAIDYGLTYVVQYIVQNRG